jgi:hypothetical protein
MFVVQLKFSANKAKAGQFMDGHKAWLRAPVHGDRGFRLMATTISSG